MTRLGRKPSSRVHPKCRKTRSPDSKLEHRHLTRGPGKQQCRAPWKRHLEVGWQLGGNAETETGRTLGKCSLVEHFLLVLDLSDCSWAVMTLLCASKLGMGYARMPMKFYKKNLAWSTSWCQGNCLKTVASGGKEGLDPALGIQGDEGAASVVLPSMQDTVCAPLPMCPFLHPPQHSHILGKGLASSDRRSEGLSQSHQVWSTESRVSKRECGES